MKGIWLFGPQKIHLTFSPLLFESFVIVEWRWWRPCNCVVRKQRVFAIESKQEDQTNPNDKKIITLFEFSLFRHDDDGDGFIDEWHGIECELWGAEL